MSPLPGTAPDPKPALCAVRRNPLAGVLLSLRIHKPSPTRRGFSTVELVTALAIGMILTVVGLAGLRMVQVEERVESAAVRLSNALSAARTLAVSQNGFYRVALDLDRSNFWIDEIEDPAIDPLADPLTPKVVHPEELGELVIVESVLIQGVGTPVTSGLQAFVFRPDGSADVEAIITLMISSQDATIEENLTTVRLYGATGSNTVFPRERLTF